MSGAGETGMAPRQVIVVGGAVAGWMAGAVLAQALRGLKAVEITVLDLDVADEPPALASLPSLRSLHRFIGLPEEQVMATARGTYRLGVRFDGWSGARSSRFLPFGEVGASLGSVAFHHMLVRLQRQGRPHDPDDYAIAALAARAGRFSPPLSDARSVLSTLDCGLHLDPARYAALLRSRAETLGVRRVTGELAEVSLQGPGGAIDGLVLGDGRRLAGDLFIDCSGREALLIGRALGVGLEDWSSLSPFDRTARALCPAREAPKPFTRITADETGWLQRIPLQGATGLTFAYAGERLDPAAAAARLRAAAGSAVEVTDEAAAFARRSVAWSGNCIALGAAAGSPGSLPGVGPHQVQTGLQRLLSLFPFAEGNDGAVAEYNRLAAAEAERLRDFTLIQLHTNRRLGDPDWDACRAGRLPEELAYKVRLFESRGRTPMGEEETFPEASWASVFLGQGVTPRRYDALADAMPLAELERVLARMRSAMSEAVKAMPSHADYLAAHARWSPVEAR